MKRKSNMYEETGCFDPNSMGEDDGSDNGLFSQTAASCSPLQPQSLMGMAGSTTNSHTSFEDNLKLAYHHQEDHDASVAAAAAAAAVLDMEIQQQFMENNTHLMQQEALSNNYDQPNWDAGGERVHEIQDVETFLHHSSHHQQDQQVLQNGHQGFNMVLSSSSPEAPYTPTPDLLNLLHLPRCSLLPSSSISFSNSNLPAAAPAAAADIAPSSSVLYDPLFHLNLPPQPPLFRELLQSLPHGYTLPTPSRGSGSLFDDEREASGGVYHDGDNGVFEFTTGTMGFSSSPGLGKRRQAGKGTKHFATERDRRVHLNDKFKALREMVPKPSKSDRASIVGDAIEYIQELRRTVQELKFLVDKKRCHKERIKRQKTEGEDAAGDVEAKPIADPDQCYNSSLRSSWLQRKSKETEVDVRIIDDEVTIKLVQRKKINCLLFVSRVLDELQLDLHHVAGGHVGDYYSFLLNSKIYEGSSVYASAIANKLIEVVDRQYAAAPPAAAY